MKKSPEQYLAEFDFSLPDKEEGEVALNAGERVFVEKYLGMEAFEKMPMLQPESYSVPLPLPVKEKIIEVSSEEPFSIEISQPETIPEEQALPVSEAHLDAPPLIAPLIEPPAPKPEILVSEAIIEPEIVVETEPEEAAVVEANLHIEAETAAAPAPISAPPVAQLQETPILPVAQELISLRERLQTETEIQTVSFFVGDKLFLLPVASIQEVLRHMELVKIPQAPEFIAGAINLRGNVIPVVFLSNLLADDPAPEYSDRNFVIVCGAGDLTLGLVIDRINSMHILPKEKIIMNAEARIGDIGEFFAGVVNLDDSVRGIIAPEAITQKLLSN